MTVPKIWRNIPEKYSLIGNRCNECKEYHFPAREVCMHCGSQNFSEMQFCGKGEVVTFTIIRTPISDPEHENIDISFRDIPYFLAIIKLEEGPLITGEIVDSEEMRIGDKVEMVFRKILEKGERGVIQYGYKFKIVR